MEKKLALFLVSFCLLFILTSCGGGKDSEIVNDYVDQVSNGGQDYEDGYDQASSDMQNPEYRDGYEDGVRDSGLFSDDDSANDRNEASSDHDARGDFEDGSLISRDLEKIGAIKENREKGRLAAMLVGEYDLSERRSLKIAKMMFSWKKMSKSRSMTDADAKSFSLGFLGFDFSTLRKAIEEKEQGDKAAYDLLLESAADFNDTSPENVNDIIDRMLH